MEHDYIKNFISSFFLEADIYELPKKGRIKDAIVCRLLLYMLFYKQRFYTSNTRLKLTTNQAKR